MITFTLQELLSLNIDSWVRAISETADKYGQFIEGYCEDKCPADFEREFVALANKKQLRFDAEGKLKEDSNG